MVGVLRETGRVTRPKLSSAGRGRGRGGAREDGAISDGRVAEGPGPTKVPHDSCSAVCISAL